MQMQTEVAVYFQHSIFCVLKNNMKVLTFELSFLKINLNNLKKQGLKPFG